MQVNAFVPKTGVAGALRPSPPSCWFLPGLCMWKWGADFYCLSVAASSDEPGSEALIRYSARLLPLLRDSSLPGAFQTWS